MVSSIKYLTFDGDYRIPYKKTVTKMGFHITTGFQNNYPKSKIHDSDLLTKNLTAMTRTVAAPYYSIFDFLPSFCCPDGFKKATQNHK